MKKIVITSLIFLALFGIRIYYVNANVPQESVEVYRENEWVAYEGAYQFDAMENTDGYFVKVNRSELISLKEYLEIYDLNADSYFALLQDYYEIDKEVLLEQNVLDIELEFKNQYSEEGWVTLDELLVFGDGDNISYMINESILLEMYPVLETSGGLGFTLKPNGESVELNIPFMLPIYTNGAIGEETGSWSKNLTLTRMPVKKCIAIE